MPSLIKIPIKVNGLAHHRFEWKSENYKKLKAIFCSPDLELALTFNDGREVFLRQFDFNKAISIPPNSRVLFVDKDLDNELIIGIISVGNIKSVNNKGQLAVYLIVEK